MARWFDNAAKSAARRELSAAALPGEGITRRTVLTRGAVVAGVAWTAPMLMQTKAFAVGSSACPPGTPKICNSTDGTHYACCTASTDTCSQNVTTGEVMCIPLGSAGGTCSNEGVGVCTGGGQTKPSSQKLCREERVENLGSNFVIHPGTGVFHTKVDSFVRFSGTGRKAN